MEIDGSPNTITTKTSIARKIRSKEYAHSLKTGSPKLRDLMRQKCKIRMKESRTATFDSPRNIFGNKQESVDDIIKEELKEFTDNLELQETIFNEMIDEARLWNFDHDFEHLVNLEDDIQYICPVCQLGRYIQSTDTSNIKCSLCKIIFECVDTIDHFKYRIQRNLLEHDNSDCTATVKFGTEPLLDKGTHCLIMLCDLCDMMCIV